MCATEQPVVVYVGVFVEHPVVYATEHLAVVCVIVCVENPVVYATESLAVVVAESVIVVVVVVVDDSVNPNYQPLCPLLFRVGSLSRRYGPCHDEVIPLRNLLPNYEGHYLYRNQASRKVSFLAWRYAVCQSNLQI